MDDNQAFAESMRLFLELCKDELDLEKLPKIIWLTTGGISGAHPTFGMFSNKDQVIRIEIKNRHPLDIMRTLAHELVHYKQWLKKELNSKSGETGSPQENQAHAVAGIIMRHFDRAHPELFKSNPVG